ncbi:Uma2 family endonuclease [Gracilibacillus saliphilus]|uniref:Uma2 family endonuclease n=1 Tax=Gracilibacillus saliphilus TaxID=543890 RepID=UPI003B517D25
MKYGVQEYWIVHPLLKSIQVYVLQTDQTYVQQHIAKENEIASSTLFHDFSVVVTKLFSI